MSNACVLSAALLAASIFTSACGGATSNANSPAVLSPERHSYPFNVGEPKAYAAKVRVTTAAGTTEYFLARNGERSRVDVNVGTPRHTSHIIADREIFVDYARRSYHVVRGGNAESAELGDTDIVFRGMFYTGERTEFEEAGSENGLTRYRVKFSPDQTGEAYVYVDADTGMIMRQSFFAGPAESNPPLYSAEVIEFTMSAEDGLFAVPPGFSEVKRTPGDER